MAAADYDIPPVVTSKAEACLRADFDWDVRNHKLVAMHVSHHPWTLAATSCSMPYQGISRLDAYYPSCAEDTSPHFLTSAVSGSAEV